MLRLKVNSGFLFWDQKCADATTVAERKKPAGFDYDHTLFAWVRW